MSHAAPCQPSLGLDSSDIWEGFQDVYRKRSDYCIHFLPSLDLDLPLSTPRLPSKYQRQSLDLRRRSSPLLHSCSTSCTSQPLSKISSIQTPLLSHDAAWPVACSRCLCFLFISYSLLHVDYLCRTVSVCI